MTSLPRPVAPLVLLGLVGLALGLYLARDMPAASAGPAGAGTDPAGAAAVPAGSTQARAAAGAAPVHGSVDLLDFRTSPDFGVLLAHVLPLAEAGDAAAAELVDRIYDYCSVALASRVPLEANATLLAADDPARAQAIRAAALRVTARCRTVNGGNPIPDEVREAAALRAATLGHPQALARRALRDVQASPTDRVAALSGAMASGDPEALFEAGSLAAFSQAQPGSGMQDLTGSELTAFAWQAAACRLGADCAAGGPAMDAFCAWGTACGYPGYEDFLRHAGIPMALWPLFEEKVRRILALQRATSGG